MSVRTWDDVPSAVYEAISEFKKLASSSNSLAAINTRTNPGGKVTVDDSIDKAVEHVLRLKPKPLTPPGQDAPTRDTVVAGLGGGAALGGRQSFAQPADGLSSLPGLSDAADILGWTAGPINAHWGGPRPLTTILIGAGLGGLLGRAGSYVTSKLAPEGFLDEEEHRKKMTRLGAILGSIPGLYQTYDNYTQGRGPWSSWPAKAGSAEDPYYKEAMNMFDPLINKGQFNPAVMADPNTPPHIRAATAGIVEAASATRGSSFVSPWDVARIAISAGAGAASGIVLGKTLGVLAGLSKEQQKNLQEIGWWSGILRSMVPQALNMGAYRG